MVLAFDEQSHRALNAQFENRLVKKNYVAVLDGVVKEQEGRVELKHRVDLENRPRQILDDVYGKLAVTEWKRLRVWTRRGAAGKERKATSVLFTPLTGRTHQLRVAAAFALGAPIVGDNLYGLDVACDNLYGRKEGSVGNVEGRASGRLLLHACDLAFAHPVTGQEMSFHSEPDFAY